MLRIVFILALMAFPALGETIRVTSGEHDSFSRLVFALPAAQAWQVGRTATGYELALAEGAPRFDVSSVFDLIPKDRLTGIYVDPNTGNLQMTIGCQCHALPFSLNERTIVIDLRDGPAPATSSFERALDGRALPALSLKPEALIRPRPRQPEAPLPTYDWLAASPPPSEPTVPFPIPQGSDESENIRETLVAQLADGAARAVIELALPQNSNTGLDAPFLSEDVPIRVTGSLGLQIGAKRVEAETLQADGQACIADDKIDLNTWAQADETTAQYSGLSNQLVGEFDRPQNEAIIAAAKRFLYLGFGAEARSMLTAFGDLGDDGAILLELADLIDGETPSEFGAFEGMSACDSAAAMWAFLAQGPDPLHALNQPAFKRAFSALPSHLRTHLGPRLVEKLIAEGKNDTAFAIQESLSRGQPADTRAISMATSEVLMANGDANEAIPHLEEIIADPGQMQAQAMVKLIEAQIAAEQPVDPATADAIYAMIDEYKGHPLQADLIAAYGLSLIGSLQFAQAMDFAQQGHPLNPAFWTRLADKGTDDDVLLFALKPPEEMVQAKAAAMIANRLGALGFPSEAAAWLMAFPSNEGVVGLETMPPDMQSMEGNSAAAVADTGVTNPSAQEAAAVDTITRAARWDQNWTTVAGIETGAWGQLAQGLDDPPVFPEVASLASANESLAQSAEARKLIEELLKETEGNSVTP